VPADVNEDSIEADMKNGVLRVELEREDTEDEELTVDTINRTDEKISGENSNDVDEVGDLDEEPDLTELFDEEESEDDDDDEDN